MIRQTMNTALRARKKTKRHPRLVLEHLFLFLLGSRLAAQRNCPYWRTVKRVLYFNLIYRNVLSVRGALLHAELAGKARPVGRGHGGIWGYPGAGAGAGAMLSGANTRSIPTVTRVKSLPLFPGDTPGRPLLPSSWAGALV